jgi:hypothetical protein
MLMLVELSNLQEVYVQRSVVVFRVVVGHGQEKLYASGGGKDAIYGRSVEGDGTRGL